MIDQAVGGFQIFVSDSDRVESVKCAEKTAEERNEG
jgi:hypothetical protein